MEYLTVRETAEKWNISPRLVQQLCTAGRVPGARKFGKSWAILADAEKPRSPRSARPDPAPLPAVSEHLMPLMNTPFQPGRCLEAVEAMEPGPRRDIARAEYHYFTAQPEQAAREAEPYLTGPDVGARLSACLIYAYANLSIHQIQHARFALNEVQRALAAGGEAAPHLRAAGAFVAAASAVLLHLPLPADLPSTQELLPLLPPGLRAFALYVQAHYLYLRKDYAQSVGVAETALAMGAAQYPIPAIYLHLMAVMDHMSLKQTERARAHLLSAWALARPDDLIEGFGEHHGLLGGHAGDGHQAGVAGGLPADHRHHLPLLLGLAARPQPGHRPRGGGQPDHNGVCRGHAGGPGLDHRGDCRPHGRLRLHRQAPPGPGQGEAAPGQPAGAEPVYAGVTPRALRDGEQERARRAGALFRAVSRDREEIFQETDRSAPFRPKDQQRVISAFGADMTLFSRPKGEWRGETNHGRIRMNDPREAQSHFRLQRISDTKAMAFVSYGGPIRPGSPAPAGNGTS